MGSIIVGYDGSEGARKAVDRATSMVRDGDKIVVLFVVPPTTMEEFAGFDKDLTIEKARAALNDVIKVLSKKGMDVLGIIREGDVADEIVELGREMECDLIVVGSHGLSKVGTFALGDVAEKVARKSTRPVLLVK